MQALMLKAAPSQNRTHFTAVDEKYTHNMQPLMLESFISRNRTHLTAVDE